MSSYIPINPNDFTVKDAINHLNSNIDYLYGLSRDSQNIINNVTNLIPYTDFSIQANIEYWLPYKNSKLAIKDATLYSYSFDKVVGVISPIITTQLKPNTEYTLMIKTKSNTEKAILNEIYIQKSNNETIRLNLDENLSNNFKEHYLYFKVDDYIQDFRIIIGTGDTIENPEEIFKFTNIITKSNLINNELVAVNYNASKGSYSSNYYFKDSIYYMLATRDLTPLNYVMSFFSNDEIPSTPSGDKYSLLDTFLLNLLKIKLELEGVSRFQGAHVPIFNHLGKLYNDSLEKGLFSVLNGELEYSLLLSLYALDIIDLWLDSEGNYEGSNYDLETIRTSILNYVENNYDKIYDNNLLYGGIKIGEKTTYGYLNDLNRYSTSTISLVYQVELIRLVGKVGILDNIEGICDKLLSYKQNNMECVIPNTIKTTEIPTADAEISITVPSLIVNIVNNFPNAFKNPSEYRKRLVTSINTLKAPNGLYKFDYTLDNEVYSSNQYLDSLLDGTTYLIPRDMYIGNLLLCEGRITSKDVITSTDTTIKDLYNKIESTIKRTDFSINEDSIIASVGNQFISKDYLNGELVSIETRLEQAELALKEDSIIATVTKSSEWIDMTNDVNNRLQIAEAQISVNTDAITNKVWSSDIQEAVSGMSNIGYNLIRNSNFINTNQYWSIENIDKCSFNTQASGKSWMTYTDTSMMVFSQICTDMLSNGACNISFDAYGNGTIRVIVRNESSVLVDYKVTPSIADSRFNISFQNSNRCKPTVEFRLNSNTSLSITNIKLCMGIYDYGWTPHKNDITDFKNSLDVDFDSLYNDTNISFSDDNLTDDEKTFISQSLIDINDKNKQLLSLYNDVSNNKSIQDSPYIEEAIIGYNDYINNYNDLVDYINTSLDTGDFDEDIFSNLYTEHSNSLDELFEVINKLNTLTSVESADDNSSNNLSDVINKSFDDINNVLKSIQNDIMDIFSDDTLSDDERLTIDNLRHLLSKEMADIQENVDYYNDYIANPNNPDLISLNEAYEAYKSSVGDVNSQLDLIMNSDTITQDMRYTLNGLIIVVDDKDYDVRQALTNIANKYSNESLDKAISNITTALEGLTSSVSDLSSDLEKAKTDDILTTQEKALLEADLDKLAKKKTLVDVELDYYIEHPSLEGTTELTNLLNVDSKLDANYNALESELNTILESNVFDDTTLDEWYNLVSQLDSLTTDAIHAVTQASQRLEVEGTSTGNDALIKDINNLEESLNGVLNFTDEIFEDNMLSYIEAMSLNSVLGTLKNDSTKVTSEVEELLKHSSLVGTSALNDLQNNLTTYNNSYSALEQTIYDIISDSKITDEERILYDEATLDYQTSISNLEVSIVQAYNTITDNIVVNAGSVTPEYVNNKVQEVQDALDDLANLSNSTFVDNIVVESERKALEVSKDILYKEHLDVIKQLDVFLDATLTPELIGNEVLIDLNNNKTSLGNAYTTLENELNTIINAVVLSEIDKTNYNNALEAYREVLSTVRETLKVASLALADKNLDEFIQGEFSSLVERVSNAELKITDEAIVSTVESKTTTLIKRTEFDDELNEVNTQIESVQSTVASHTTSLDGITSRVSSSESRIDTIDGSISSLNTRVNTAEQKITDEAIVNTVTSSTSWSNQTANISSATQTANKINWLISSGTSSSNMTMTSNALKIISDNIDLTGRVTFSSFSSDVVNEIEDIASESASDAISTTVIDGSQIRTGTITATQIASGAITSNKIAAYAVTSEKIDTYSITADKIVSGAITADKIAAGAITTAKLAAGAITADMIDTSGLVVHGSMITGQINGVGGIYFAEDALITQAASGVGNNGLKLSAPVIYMDGKVWFQNTVEFYYQIKGMSGGYAYWTIDPTGAFWTNGTVAATGNITSGNNISAANITATKKITSEDDIQAYGDVAISGNMSCSTGYLSSASITGTATAKQFTATSKLLSQDSIQCWGGLACNGSMSVDATAWISTLYVNGTWVSSDERLKTDIKYVNIDKQTIDEDRALASPNTNITTTDMHEFIETVPMISYRYIKDLDRGVTTTHYGFSIQDIMYTKVGSELYDLPRDACGDELEADYYSYSQNKFISFICGALQEEIKLRKQLEQKVDELINKEVL